MVQPPWRTVWRFLKKLKIKLPYEPAIPLLGIYPEKNMAQKETCIPSTEAWIKKIWYIYTTEYYSAKTNEIKSFAATQIDLENTALSELS